MHECVASRIAGSVLPLLCSMNTIETASGWIVLVRSHTRSARGDDDNDDAEWMNSSRRNMTSDKLLICHYVLHREWEIIWQKRVGRNWMHRHRRHSHRMRTRNGVQIVSALHIGLRATVPAGIGHSIFVAVCAGAGVRVFFMHRLMCKRQRHYQYTNEFISRNHLQCNTLCVTLHPSIGAHSAHHPFHRF